MVAERTESLPAEPEPATPPVFTPERVAKWVTIFLVIGVAARAIRYLLKFPLWEDECFLCVNFIGAGFADLLRPLRTHQVAPPLFLWAELAATKVFGFNEWSLRAIPFAAGIAGLFLFRRLAGRLLTGLPLLIAVGCFAVAYPAVRHASEAKQYSTDLLAALLLLCGAVEWRFTGKRAWLWALAAAAPVMMWLSYPAAFVAGGVSLAVAAELLGRDPKWRGRLNFLGSSRQETEPSRVADWLAWAAFNAAVLVGFGTVYLVIKRQSSAELGFMTTYWADSFPPLARPWLLPVWFVKVHCGSMLAWPVGGEDWASTGTAIAMAIGVCVLLTRRDAFWVCLLLAPAAVNLFAAAIGRYPYGGHFKFSMYFGPAICLIAGWGMAAAAAKIETFPLRIGRLNHVGRYFAPAMVVYLLLITTGSALKDFAKPTKVLSDARARAFATWFWFDAEGQGPVELVDAHAGVSFCPEAIDDPYLSSMMLCNRAHLLARRPRRIGGRPDPLRLAERRPPAVRRLPHEPLPLRCRHPRRLAVRPGPHQRPDRDRILALHPQHQRRIRSRLHRLLGCLHGAPEGEFGGG